MDWSQTLLSPEQEAIKQLFDLEFEIDVKYPSQRRNNGVTDPMLELGFDVDRASLIYDRLKHENNIGPTGAMAFYSRKPVGSTEDEISMGEMFSRVMGRTANTEGTARDWWEKLKKHDELQPEYADDFEKWRDSSMVSHDDRVWLWSDALRYADPALLENQHNMADVWAHEFRHRGKEMLSRQYEAEGLDPDIIDRTLSGLGIHEEGLTRMYDWDYGSDKTRRQAVDWLSKRYKSGLGKMDEYRSVQKELNKDAQAVLDHRREERWANIPQEPPDKTWGTTILDWLFK
tara:strand:+ start:9493 stop:10356 length:864 start_codon:yes stop_codon:yes gene_type:complete